LPNPFILAGASTGVSSILIFALIDVLDRAHWGPLRGEHNQRGKVSNAYQHFSPVSLRSNPS